MPWTYAGKQVWVRERGQEVEVLYGRERIAVHGQAPRRHAVITEPEHHRGIPLGARHHEKRWSTFRTRRRWWRSVR